MTQRGESTDDTIRRLTRDGIRLNLGCADYHKLAGYVNVDVRPEAQPDLVCDVNKLTFHFDPGTVDEIYAGHLLEHMYTPLYSLRHWHDMLRPGGTLAIVIPDAIRILDRRSRPEALQMIHPRDERGELYEPPIGHCQMLDEALVMQWMRYVGFRLVRPVDIATDPRVLSHTDWQSGAAGVK